MTADDPRAPSGRGGVEVVRLSADDVPLLEELSTVFGAAFDEADTYTARRPRREYLRELLGGETFIALVALDGGAVVGGLAGYELRKFERERSEIYLYDLAVSETHRRRGIASALLRELRRVARERGAYVVFVQADRGDDPAIALYERFGVREDVLHFDIEVGEGGATTPD